MQKHKISTKQKQLWENPKHFQKINLPPNKATHFHKTTTVLEYKTFPDNKKQFQKTQPHPEV